LTCKTFNIFIITFKHCICSCSFCCKKKVEGFHAAAKTKIAIHYNTSEHAAKQLADELNAIRKDSAIIVQANLLSKDDIDRMCLKVVETFGGLDLLVCL
jgi:NAD(P)-dependent dehydrogenase (short-subunit alcohol dehydrogenase family)